MPKDVAVRIVEDPKQGIHCDYRMLGDHVGRESPGGWQLHAVPNYSRPVAAGSSK